jgi:ATP-dependent DNA ligase
LSEVAARRGDEERAGHAAIQRSRRRHGPAFFRQACKLGAEGIVSKRAVAPYRPGDRGGAWLKTKCLNREEFIVVGWTDPGVAGRISARSCSPITRLMAVWCTPAARARACP